MPGINETKDSIASIKSTRKITRAMYLVSASKSKKARTLYERTLPYFQQITATLSEIIAETEPFDTPFFHAGSLSAGKGNLYIVLSGDKGLAGGYIHNLIELLEQRIDKAAATLWVAGITGRNRIAGKGYQVSPDFTYPVADPDLFRAREISEAIVKSYLNRSFKHVYLVFTEMINPLNLKPNMARLLPFRPGDFMRQFPEAESNRKTVYEPNPKAVFEHLAPYYIKGVIYSALMSAYTSEQHARMYAMDNATKSANDLIEELSLRYNRARQAQITQEINEIVGGIPSE